MSLQNIDVLIVGAGLVGAGPVDLFCANELHRHGLTFRIIDKKAALSTHSKALGIHIQTLEMLEDTKLLDDFLTQGHQVNQINVQSKGKTIID